MFFQNVGIYITCKSTRRYNPEDPHRYFNHTAFSFKLYDLEGKMLVQPCIQYCIRIRVPYEQYRALLVKTTGAHVRKLDVSGCFQIFLWKGRGKL
jgi:hypothetical protein